jgi:hypothetical protein
MMKETEYGSFGKSDGVGEFPNRRVEILRVNNYAKKAQPQSAR